MGFLYFFALAALFGFAFAEDPLETFFCNTFVRAKGYTCTEYQTTTYDGYILNLQRVGPKLKVSSSPPVSPSPPPNLGAQILNVFGPYVEGLTRSRISTSGTPTTTLVTETSTLPMDGPPATRMTTGRGDRGVSRVADPPTVNIGGAPPVSFPSVSPHTSAFPPIPRMNPPAAAAKPPTSIQPPPPPPKYPIFLDHALFFGGDIWFDGPPPSTRLPFLLADAGFDVYVGQHRATKYSPDSVNHPRDSFDIHNDNGMTTPHPYMFHQNYWDFTFDDIAKYDLPPLIKLVQGVSGQQRVHYIGFNQGGILPLAALASDPSFAKNLASLILIGPITFIGNITSPVLYSWGTGFSPDEVFYNQRLVNGEYNLTNTQNLNDVLELVGGNIGNLFGGGSTNQLLNNVTGPNCCVPDETIAGFNSQIDPNWVVASYKNLVQYQQEIRSGKFAKYNYGTAVGNQQAYNQTQSPSYDLSLIPPSLPIFLVSGENDWFADRKNIQKLKANLPQDVTHLEVPKYAHFDLIFSENIVKDVYTPIINYLRKGYRG